MEAHEATATDRTDALGGSSTPGSLSISHPDARLFKAIGHH
jgi:hypothetical protein